jgi:hypothetical protein
MQVGHGISSNAIGRLEGIARGSLLAASQDCGSIAFHPAFISNACARGGALARTTNIFSILRHDGDIQIRRLKW